MKFCSKCGKELMDEAVVCPGCGCAVASTENSHTKVTRTKTPLSNKTIVIYITAAVALVLLIIGGIFLWNHIRTEQVKEQLAGETFYYFDDLYLLDYSYTEKKFTVDDNAQCEYFYYYSSIDAGQTYTMDYEIKFENGTVFLIAGINTYEIQYDKHGDIKCLYDVDLEETFKRQ